ncbi:MAG: DUF1697 domain-containing protein [Acidimicrobiaceae bacterium]|nr:DUF1697 domain-containing protein [Acidimicrobiaceae bacterium]
MQNVALLRGINVARRTMPMSELTACLSGVGLGEVTTVLQTGNVIFSSDSALRSLKLTIEAGLTERFNYPAHVLVYRMERLRRIVESTPFDADDSMMHSYVVFFEDGLELKLMAEARDLDHKVEAIGLGDSVLYWRVLKGSTLQSGFARYLTKARYKDFHTNRNIKTLRKIVASRAAT